MHNSPMTQAIRRITVPEVHRRRTGEVVSMANMRDSLESTRMPSGVRNRLAVSSGDNQQDSLSDATKPMSPSESSPSDMLRWMAPSSFPGFSAKPPCNNRLLLSSSYLVVCGRPYRAVAVTERHAAAAFWRKRYWAGLIDGIGFRASLMLWPAGFNDVGDALLNDGPLCELSGFRGEGTKGLYLLFPEGEGGMLTNWYYVCFFRTMVAETPSYLSYSIVCRF